MGLSELLIVACFLVLQPSGPGRYMFELGCQQSGDYVLEERPKEGEGEEEEEQATLVPRWRGAGISAN